MGEGTDRENAITQELDKTKHHAPTDRLDQSDSNLTFRNEVQAEVENNLEHPSGLTTYGVTHQSSIARKASLSGSEPNSRYSKIREHARGGLGLVYLAQDRELQREVAIKEIQRKLVNRPESKTRFLLEAQLTGWLEHPGIVPVYGLGKYPDGSPYYVMRFIQGESFARQIESFHNAHPAKNSNIFDSREFRGLIGRFVDVCNAIHYAHEKGVIHRDIKPANIMLGKYGETLVVDWGLAKCLRSNTQINSADTKPLTAQDNHFDSSSTRNGELMGTPLYMSPEQAKGLNQQLTPVSDVFSLGATLLTLITGDRPVNGQTTPVVLQNLRQGKVRFVREIVSAAPKSLDAICRKAMAIAPENRYPTAEALAEDLERWMADEAVNALQGKESWLDVSGRLMRRYRSWTVPLAVSILLVSILSVIAAILVNDARKKEYIAKNEAQSYRRDALDRYRVSRSAIDNWLIESSEALTYFPATQSIRKELLTRAAKDYAALSESASKDPELQLESIRAMARVGDIQMDQEEYVQARKSYETAMVEFNSEPVMLPSLGDLMLRWRVERARTRSKLGALCAAELELGQATIHFNASLDELDRVRTANPMSTLVNLALAKTLDSYATMLTQNGRYPEALPLLEKSVSLFPEPFATDDPQEKLAVASIRIGLGRVLGKLGRRTESTSAFSSAIGLLEKLTQEQPDQPVFVDALANALVSRAAAQQAQGQTEDQLRDLRTAEELYERLHLSMPDVPRYSEAHAITLIDIGLVQYVSGKLADSLLSLAAARQQIGELVDYYPRVPSFRFHLAAALDGLSQVYRVRGDNAEALESGNSAYIVYEDLASQAAAKGDGGELSAAVERAAVVASHIAQVQAAVGESDLALESFDRAIDYLEKLSTGEPNISDYRNELAHVHFHKGCTQVEQKPNLAKEHFKSACALWAELSDETQAADFAFQLARFHLNCPDLELRDSQVALAAATKAFRLSPKNHSFQLILAEAQANVGFVEDCQRTLDYSSEIHGTSSAGYWCVVALVCHSQSDPVCARAALQKAAQLTAEIRPGDVEMRRKLEEIQTLLK